jgi:aspartyl protease family protein
MNHNEHEELKTQKRMGFGMVVGMWLLILAIFMYFFGTVLEDMQNPNQTVATTVNSDGIREVVLKRNRFGHYVSSGEINGRRVQFMVDTGASDVAVPESLARSMGLKRGAQQMLMTANGTAVGYLTRLDSVAVGNIVLHDVRATIVPGMSGMSGLDSTEVLLGMAFLKNIEFIQRGNELTLRQQPE